MQKEKISDNLLNCKAKSYLREVLVFLEILADLEDPGGEITIFISKCGGGRGTICFLKRIPIIYSLLMFL